MTVAVERVKWGGDADFELAQDPCGLIICIFFVIYGIYGRLDAKNFIRSISYP
jgi:hypothetical protein